jgi:hypothetical protein
MADPFLVQAIESGGSTPLNAEAAAIWEQALAKASSYLANLLSDPNRETLFADVFSHAGTDSTTFAANLQNLIANLGGDGLRIAVDLRSDDELGGAFAAYAASGHTGSERIYVNADKLNNGLLDVTLATSALLEEFGHALDRRLNGGVDSPGDEGQLFAAEVTGVVLTAEQRAAIDAEDDTAVLTIEGVQVVVEQADGTVGSTGSNGTNSLHHLRQRLAERVAMARPGRWAARVAQAEQGAEGDQVLRYPPPPPRKFQKLEPSEASAAMVPRVAPASAARSAALAQPASSWTRPPRFQARRSPAGRAAPASAAGLVVSVAEAGMGAMGVMAAPKMTRPSPFLPKKMVSLAALVARAATAATVASEGLAEMVAEEARVSAFLQTPS